MGKTDVIYVRLTEQSHEIMREIAIRTGLSMREIIQQIVNERFRIGPSLTDTIDGLMRERSEGWKKVDTGHDKETDD